MNAVVIGGGLAGLVAARELLRQGYRVTLCEASPHLGGMIARSNVGGITVDSGAEAFATRIPAARELCAELGLETAAPAGSPHIWWPEGIVSMAEYVQDAATMTQLFGAGVDYVQGHFLAHVDLARLGVADRWADLAVATMSLGWNFDDVDEDLFWRIYGVEPDPGRIAYYRALWDAT